MATLRQIWRQHDLPIAAPVRCRTAEDGRPPAARFRSAPHDREAPLAKQGAPGWRGDTVARTETCEDDAPALSTHVETVAGPSAAGAMPPRIHPGRTDQHLLPAVQLVDPGLLAAELLVDSQTT